MNLIKDSMTIPLYFKEYENISKVIDSPYVPNNELLWILKEGFTLTSMGLHNLDTIEKETGKSSLLNEIFPVYF